MHGTDRDITYRPTAQIAVQFSFQSESGASFSCSFIDDVANELGSIFPEAMPAIKLMEPIFDATCCAIDQNTC